MLRPVKRKGNIHYILIECPEGTHMKLYTVARRLMRIVEVFERVYEVLEKEGCIGIFPEGRNSPKRQIAEQAQTGLEYFWIRTAETRRRLLALRSNGGRIRPHGQKW